MSSTGASNLGKRLSSEMEHAQRVLDMDAGQQLKLKERQRFFEEVLQHDVDVYLSTSHLQIDNKKPPMGSISSMEVNVDLLEQMDLMDISDHEALDVFLNSGSDTGPLASPLPDVCDEDDDDDEDENELIYKDGVGPQGSIRRRPGSKNRGSSGSTGSADPDSQDTSEGGDYTPVIQSDEEEVQVDTFLFSATSSGKEEEEEEENEE
ncbi:hypothetical protein AALO_G00049810 [Alosa alosa]|uniref:Dysbindin-like n=2 Tax=Alosa alosa TaxID=278164 RepID=A0AAV6H3L4_9TELE|nr:dysbindin-like isoform X1 [Alosa alosa]KAG5281878.1 hypothetical protein AALO_G00049810 [Alosa alosa]